MQQAATQCRGRRDALKANPIRQSMSEMCKLHINGKVWLYKIGGSGNSHPQNVVVRSPDNKRFNV